MLDLSKAAVGLTDCGVTINDPGSPWLVRCARVELVGARLQLVNMHVTAREGALSAPRLSRLPLRAITRLVAALQFGATHPNESHYRMLATDNTGGDHHRRVLAVRDWAIATSRPGGGAATVAEFWGVSLRTAYRWIAAAQVRPESAAEPVPPQTGATVPAAVRGR